MTLRTLAALLWLALAGLTAGCGMDGGDEELTIFAAASLGHAFEDLIEEFEQINPDVRVTLNLGGSSTLREQILEGAPADVFASASPEIMAELQEAELTTDEPIVFAGNAMAIVVPAGEQGQVGLTDFAREELSIGLCASQVPCGRYADELLALAGIVPAPDTREPDVRALLAKVAEGELDVGLVYRTDLANSDAVAGWVPTENVDVRYPIAPLTTGAHAHAFVAFVLSEAGQAVLADHGFLPS